MEEVRRRWGRFVRERGRWLSMSRCGRGEVPRGSWSPGLDWTGLDWRAGRVNLGRCLSVHSLLSVSTRFSARKLGKYLGQQQVSRYLPGRLGRREHRAAVPRAPEPQSRVADRVTERPGPARRARCCIGYEDSTIETRPAHWPQGWFDVRISQPKLGWDADSVRKLSPDLQRTSY